MKYRFISILFISIKFTFTYSQDLVNIDTTELISLHNFENTKHCLSFGSLGSVNRSLQFTQSHSFLNKSPFFTENIQELNSYYVNKPILDATYVTGTNNEQYFSIFHTQKLAQNISYALLYNKKSSDGYYINQATKHNNFQANISISNLNYKAKLFYNINSLYFEHNGGIIEDSAFILDQNVPRDRMLLDVNLEDAYERNKNQYLGLNQQFYLLRKTDSLNKKACHKINVNLALNQKSRFYFDSIINNYFPITLVDSNSTNDTIRQDQIIGEISYKAQFIQDSSKIKNINLGFKSNLINHKNNLIDTTFYNISSFIKMYIMDSSYYLGIDASYYLSGYKKEDFDFKLSYNLRNNKFNLYTNAQFQNITPLFELQRYIGNHNFWNNTLSKQRVLSIFTQIEYKEYKLSTTYNDVFNPIYFENNINISQSKEVAQVIQTKVSKNYRFNKFYLNPELTYQYQGGAKIFQLPEWIGLLDLSYKTSLFSSAMKVKFGIETLFFSDFKLMSYSPDIGIFSLNDNKTQEKYFISNFYFDAKIQKVNFFFKISHLNSGLLGYNYFAALHYPFADRYFKIGVKWTFVD